MASGRNRSRVMRAISAAFCGLVVNRGGVTAKRMNSPDRAAMRCCSFTRSNVAEGGARAESADGTRWRCYLGQESIRQDILGPSALGQYLPEALH